MPSTEHSLQRHLLQLKTPNSSENHSLQGFLNCAPTEEPEPLWLREGSLDR
jgi:hypothetical protein